MSLSDNRRAFLRILGVGGIAAALAGTGGESHGDTPNRRFSGTSKKGDLTEALQNAVAAAERSVRHPDAMVDWTLKSVSGRSGGIAGFREITVMIEAKVS